MNIDSWLLVAAVAMLLWLVFRIEWLSKKDNANKKDEPPPLPPPPPGPK